MKLSRKSEYAILAMISLARNYGQKLMTIQNLADENEIPRKFLEQILIDLKRQKLVRSIRGPHGGYLLAKNPEEITLARIIRLFEGPLASVDSASVHFFDHTPIEKNRKFMKLLKEIRDYVSFKLEHCTLDELI